jgi:hypothetical protein
MFPGLSTPLETSLKFSLPGRNHQDGDIGLSGTADHAGNVCLVSGRVEDGVSSFVGLEIRSTDFDGFTLKEGGGGTEVKCQCAYAAIVPRGGLR